MSIAVDNDGTLRGLRVDLVFDQGAYPAFPITVAMFAGMMRVTFPGSYRWDAFEIRARAVATNKGRYVVYRGPWANETWARERMLDIVARALDMRPTDLRLKNMMGEDDMAPAMITGPTLDATMSTKKTLERAIELIDIERLPRRTGTGPYGRSLPGARDRRRTTRRLRDRRTTCRR